MYGDEIFAVNYVADGIVGDAFDFRLKIETMERFFFFLFNVKLVNHSYCQSSYNQKDTPMKHEQIDRSEKK